MNKAVMALAAIAGATLSVPAFAGGNSAIVRTSDLDLASASGRQALHRRIAFAAEKVCIVEGDRSLRAFVEGNRCYNAAMQSAHQQVAQVSGTIRIAAR